ncbi:MAG TPA: serine hydrolase domain-containing protein [Polyangiales bacterium]
MDAALTASLHAQMRLGQWPALSVRLLHAGAPVLALDLGHRDREARTPLHARDRFRLGCLTKPVVAEAILLLEQRGRIRLEDSISRFVPGLSGFAAVTLEQLLTHASGLVRGHYQLEPLRDDETLQRIAASRLCFTPGERRKYSHWGYFLLGRVIAAVSGQTPEAFIRTHILEPRGLHDCSFADEGERAVVTGYWSGWHFGTREPARAASRCTHVHLPACAGGLIASADDAVRWLDALRGEAGRMFELRARKSYVYTLGGFAADVLEDRVCYHFSAFSSGASCFAFVLPERELVGIALCNHQSGHHELRPLLAEVCREAIAGESLTPNREWNAAPRTAPRAHAATKKRREFLPPTQEELAAFAGRYHHPVLGFAEVTHEAGRLYVDYGDQSGCELRPRGALRFVHRTGPFRHELLEFGRGETGVDRFVVAGLTFART